MNQTIEKRPHELKAGDIVNYDCGACIIVKVRNVSAEGSVDAYIVEMHGITPEVEIMTFSGTCYVSAPDLTPAQQHADELLAVVRGTADMGVDTNAQSLLRECARRLLGRIDPPTPPTLEEALAALDSLRKAGTAAGWEEREAADKVLNQARHAGVL